MNRTMRHPPQGPHIELITSMWMKDSHGLYDYEASEENYKKDVIFMKANGKVFRDTMRNQTIIQPIGSRHQVPHTFIGDVYIDKTIKPPQFKIKCARKQSENNEINNHHKTPYLVVRDFTENESQMGYPLRPGNVIKLGRVQYMVIQSKNDDETFTLRDTNHFDQTNGVFEIKAKAPEHIQITKDDSEHHCKVCICSEETPEDPLISPCKCKGTCQLIHVNCLRTWINSKVKKQIKGIASSYNFTKFQCEICKFPFPKMVRYGSKDIEMMTITKPDKPYIILQSLCNKLQNKEERCLHLISTEENTPIKIGRGHECQIRITDISVSRKHAQIILKNGQFYISDTKAKFGTLIRVDQQLQFSSNKTIKVQCGRVVYEFKAKYEIEDLDTQ